MITTNVHKETRQAGSGGWRVFVLLVPVLALFPAGYMAHAPNHNLHFTPLWAILAVLLADVVKQRWPEVTVPEVTAPAGLAEVGTPVSRELLIPQAAGLALWLFGLGAAWFVHSDVNVWLAFMGALVTLCVWTTTYITGRRSYVALAIWLGFALLASIVGTVILPCLTQRCAGLGILDARYLGNLKLVSVALGVGFLVLTGVALRMPLRVTR